MNVANFQSDLIRGEKGELFIQSLFPDVLKRIGGRGNDMTILSGVLTGNEAEIKTDYYISDNIFVELLSDREKCLVGGPWQALKKGAKYFIFSLPHFQKVLWYTPAKLIAELEPMLSRYREIPIPNRSWVTTGYAIPRDVLEPLADRVVDLSTMSNVKIEPTPTHTIYTVDGEVFEFKKSFPRKR